ncbi:MAG: rhomboid family intramembrane serine protease [Gemmatimonadota bacterium]|nr:rhomboid family intramembrane serine protease [Gemmatimonadota bacterium]
MPGGGRPADPFSALTPWVKRLLVLNFGMWALMAIGLVSTRTALDLLAFRADRLLVRPWTFLTYAFLHGGFGHVLFNMLAVFFFGPPLERQWGGRRFLVYYLVCAAGGALAALLLVNVVGTAPMVGASGAVFGLLLAFALRWPDAPIYLWFLFPVKAKYFVGFLALATLWFTASAARTTGGTAHWAHLGGLLAGWFWLRRGDRVTAAVRRLAARLRGRPPPRSRSRGRAAGATGGAAGGRKVRPRPRPRREDPDGDTLDEVDRILDKIRESGIDALTDEERAFLDDMSRRYRDSSDRTH